MPYSAVWAAALGLDVEYFTAPDAPQHTDPVPKRHGGIRQLSLKQAAALLGVDKETVGKGLQQGVFPWGYGVKTSANRWRYIINADRFSQIEALNSGRRIRMSKPYTLASKRADAPTGCAYVAPNVLEQVVPLGWKPGIRLLPAGRAGQGRKPHRPAGFCRWRMAPGHWMDIGQLRP